jgi:hypothetical protein
VLFWDSSCGVDTSESKKMKSKNSHFFLVSIFSAENASVEFQEISRKSVKLDTIHNITVGQLIGTGTYSIYLPVILGNALGEVFRGDWQGTPVALKRLKNKEHFAEIQREGKVLL